MKITALLFLVLLVSTNAYTQLFPVAHRIDSIPFSVQAVGGKLAIRVKAFPNKGAFAQLLTLQLIDANLVLSFEYNGSLKKFQTDAVKVLGVVDPQGRTIEPRATQVQEKDLKSPSSKSIKGQRLWLDVTEEWLYFHQDYVLLVERALWEIVDCQSERPKFGLTQKWIHSVLTSLAGFVIYSASVNQTQKEESYKTYQNIWQNGSNRSEAQSFYEEALYHQKRARTMSYIGWSTLGANLAYGCYRWAKVRKKQKVYDQYCAPKPKLSLQIQPWLPLNKKAFASVNSIQLTWTF